MNQLLHRRNQRHSKRQAQWRTPQNDEQLLVENLSPVGRRIAKSKSRCRRKRWLYGRNVIEK